MPGKHRTKKFFFLKCKLIVFILRNIKIGQYSQYVNRTNIQHSKCGWTAFSLGQDEPATIENSKKWSENDLQIGGCSVDSNEDKWIVHIVYYFSVCHQIAGVKVKLFSDKFFSLKVRDSTELLFLYSKIILHI